MLVFFKNINIFGNIPRIPFHRKVSISFYKLRRPNFYGFFYINEYEITYRSSSLALSTKWMNNAFSFLGKIFRTGKNDEYEYDLKHDLVKFELIFFPLKKYMVKYKVLMNSFKKKTSMLHCIWK